MGKFVDLFRKKVSVDSHLAQMKAGISKEMALADIVDVFEKLCRTPAPGSMLLFETGTYAFGGPKKFHFDLVRQYPGRDDEYVQLRVEILYEPTAENALFSGSVWDEDVEGDFFDHIRSSPAYLWAKEYPVGEVDIFLDET